MSEFEKWAVSGMFIALAIAVVLIVFELRDLKRAAARAERDHDDLSSRLRDKYWELRRDIDSLVSAVGLYFEDAPPKRTLVKKGSPERAA